MTVSIFGNGQQLTSSALTQAQVNVIMQALLGAVLNLDMSTDTSPGFAAVRVDWPAPGQPAWEQTADVAFIQASMRNEENVTALRDEAFAAADAEHVTQTITYERVWAVHLIFYGPNSSDHARLTKSAMFLDFTGDTLAQSNLYPVLDIAEPSRSPEPYAGGWWDRSDLTIEMNEAVSESIVIGRGKSVEVKTSNRTGLVSDVTITGAN